MEGGVEELLLLQTATSNPSGKSLLEVNGN